MILFYDPEDLAQVASGAMEPFEPQPYVRWDITPYMIQPDTTYEIGTGGVAYDQARGYLYISEGSADREHHKPVIHVFAIDPPQHPDEDGQPGQPGQPVRLSDTSKNQFWMHRVSKLEGLDVRNPNGQDLGSINDFAIDMREGRIAYAIVSYGGALGMGEKYVAVPWNAIQLQPDQKRFVLNADRAQLDRLAFTKDKWPNMSDSNWGRQTAQAFGQQPYWEVYGYGLGQEVQGWSDYNKKFNASAVQTIDGTISSVSTFRPSANATEGTQLTIKGDDGKTYTCHLGPKSFVDQQGLKLDAGTPVKVTGAKANIDGRDVIIARQVHLKSDNRVLQLRDAQGNPSWSSGSMRREGSTDMKSGSDRDLDRKSEPARPSSGDEQKVPGPGFQ
jgi:sporulation protein YlmC with PRC-barrel domain